MVRARERYGLDLTEHDLAEAARTKAENGVLIARQSNGASVWMMKIKNVICRVVLSKSGHVMTFLPARSRLGKQRI